jgi:hypothetical protein
VSNLYIVEEYYDYGGPEKEIPGLHRTPGKSAGLSLTLRRRGSGYRLSRSRKEPLVFGRIRRRPRRS